MKQNICVIGLNNKYVASVGKSIADAFDMFFADITELIKFELMDVEYARAVCGDDYIHKVERSKVKAVNTFENTMFTMDYSLLNDETNLRFTQEHSYIIYLKLSKDSIEKITDRDAESGLIFDVYEFRDKLCEKYCDFVIDCDKKNEKQIINMIQQKFIEISN